MPGRVGGRTSVSVGTAVPRALFGISAAVVSSSRTQASATRQRVDQPAGPRSSAGGGASGSRVAAIDEL